MSESWKNSIVCLCKKKRQRRVNFQDEIKVKGHERFRTKSGTSMSKSLPSNPKAGGGRRFWLPTKVFAALKLRRPKSKRTTTKNRRISQKSTRKKRKGTQTTFSYIKRFYNQPLAKKKLFFLFPFLFWKFRSYFTK